MVSYSSLDEKHHHEYQFMQHQNNIIKEQQKLIDQLFTTIAIGLLNSDLKYGKLLLFHNRENLWCTELIII